MCARPARLLQRFPILPLAAMVALLSAPFASAAPISGVNAKLSIEIAGLGTVAVSGSGSVSVAGDGSIAIPAGLVSGGFLVPVTTTSSIASLSATNISNLSGTLVPGGASAISGGVCGSGGPALSEACVAGGGLGGALALTGAINVVVVPSLVIIPMDLNVLGVGQGIAGNSPFTFDAAPWTTGAARVKTGSPPYGGTFTTTGTQSGTSLTLVTATFVAACGNVIPILASLEITGIPEPGMLTLTAVGLAGLVALRIRRRS
jgi:hypothetical protein